jgi:hypothetical protein
MGLDVESELFSSYTIQLSVWTYGSKKQRSRHLHRTKQEKNESCNTDRFMSSIMSKVILTCYLVSILNCVEENRRRILLRTNLT